MASEAMVSAPTALRNDSDVDMKGSRRLSQNESGTIPERDIARFTLRFYVHGSVDRGTAELLVSGTGITRTNVDRAAGRVST